MVCLFVEETDPCSFLRVELPEQKGIITFVLGANRQRPLAGVLHNAFFNTGRRCRGQMLYVVPPFLGAYLLLDWAEKKSDLSLMTSKSLLTRKQKSLAEFERGESSDGGIRRLRNLCLIKAGLVEGELDTFSHCLFVGMSKVAVKIALGPCLRIACLCIQYSLIDRT